MKHHLTPLDATQLDSWRALAAHRQELQDFRMRQAFIDDPERFKRFSFSACGLFLDFSKNLIRQDTIDLLVKLAEEARLSDAIRAMFDGEAINASERRPVLHTALRRPIGDKVLVDGVDVMPEVHRVLHQMTELVGYVHNGLWRGYTEKPITDVVNIGIGGSFLGPQLVSEALLPFAQKGVRCHYLANIDGSEFHELASRLNAETTLFIVSSKSFGTLETLKNAQAARAWYLAQGGTEEELYRHFIAVSSNKEAAIAFGIREENIFPMWTGSAAATRCGRPSACRSPCPSASPTSRNCCPAPTTWTSISRPRRSNATSRCCSACSASGTATSGREQPRDPALRLLSAEYHRPPATTGHGIQRQERAPGRHAGHQRHRPVIWGGVGCNGQHAYHQLLHQGTQLIPADFIVPVSSYNPVADHHQWLYANCLSQSQALMLGKSREEAEAELRAKGLPEAEVQRLAPHKVIPGNRPSNTLVVERISARRLGALIAMYEHKVYVQSILWGINAFDQWGVELGKELGKGVYSRLVGSEETPAEDASTQGLIDFFRGRHRG